MNKQMMTYFCVAYGPASVALDTPVPAKSAFRRGNAYGSGTKPLPAINMIHRDIDAPVAVGIVPCLERDTAGVAHSDLQQGDPDGRVRIGRFHASAEQAIQEMKEKWAALHAAGMVYAEVCCMEVSAAFAAPAQ
jgi:hypothetical protein